MGSLYPTPAVSYSYASGRLEALTWYIHICNKLFADLVLAPNTYLLLLCHQKENTVPSDKKGYLS